MVYMRDAEQNDVTSTLKPLEQEMLLKLYNLKRQPHLKYEQETGFGSTLRLLLRRLLPEWDGGELQSTFEALVRKGLVVDVSLDVLHSSSKLVHLLDYVTDLGNTVAERILRERPNVTQD